MARLDSPETAAVDAANCCSCCGPALRPSERQVGKFFPPVSPGCSASQICLRRLIADARWLAVSFRVLTLSGSWPGQTDLTYITYCQPQKKKSPASGASVIC